MSAKDVRRFLKRFETTLTVLAREGRHVELRARFDDFQKLLSAWLDVAPPDAAPPWQMRILTIVDAFGGPFDIDTYGISRAATLSGDSSTVVVVADQLMLGAFQCYRRAQPHFMEEFLKTAVFLYRDCMESEGLASAVGHRLDSHLHTLFMEMSSMKLSAQAGEREVPGDSIPLDAVLRFSLGLINATIRFEQPFHAQYFAERIFQHRRFDNRYRSASKPLTIGREELFDYVAVVLAGWALHILQVGKFKNPDAARAVLGAALMQVPPAPILVAEWELLRGAEWFDATIDRRLGISHWDVRDWNREFRPGVTAARLHGPDWVRLGLRVALLRTDKRVAGPVAKLFSGQAQRFVWDAAKEREALQALAADPVVGLPEAARQERVDSVMQIIEQRARGANAEYLRYVLQSTLSAARVEQLRVDAKEAFDKNCSWQGALRQAGLSGGRVRICPLSTRWGLWLPREYLLDENNWASGFGEQLGEHAAAREAMTLIHLIETSARRGPELKALASLPEVLRQAQRTMPDGFKANVVILPREDRFAGALFRKPLWQIEGRREFGEASLGTWEELHVLRFPYTNPEAILVLDTHRLIAKNEMEGGMPPDRVWIDEDPDHDEVKARRAAAEAALKSADVPIPESKSIQVLAWMEVLPRLGLVDPDAALAIDIRNSDGGYAFVASSNVYHRPSCPEIEAEDAKYVLRIEPGNGKTACTTCQPERWNLEGRLGGGCPPVSG